MKLSIIILSFFVCRGNMVLSQTKSETITWINAKFNSSPIYTTSTESQVRFLKIFEDGSFQVIEKNYSPIAMPGIDSARWVIKFSGNVKDLNPNSVQIIRKGKIASRFCPMYKWG